MVRSDVPLEINSTSELPFLFATIRHHIDAQTIDATHNNGWFYWLAQLNCRSTRMKVWWWPMRLVCDACYRVIYIKRCLNEYNQITSNDESNLWAWAKYENAQWWLDEAGRNGNFGRALWFYCAKRAFFCCFFFQTSGASVFSDLRKLWDIVYRFCDTKNKIAVIRSETPRYAYSNCNNGVALARPILIEQSKHWFRPSKNISEMFAL